MRVIDVQGSRPIDTDEEDQPPASRTEKRRRGRGRPGTPFALDEDTLRQLRALLLEAPQAAARNRQVKGLLLLAEGLGPSVVARRLRVASSTVVGWRKEFERLGLGSIRAAPQAGADLR